MSDLPVLERLGIRISGWRERQRTRCWFLHDWTKWKITQDGNLKIEGRVVGKCVEQRRSCNCCGLLELKTRSWYI